MRTQRTRRPKGRQSPYKFKLQNSIKKTEPISSQGILPIMISRYFNDRPAFLLKKNNGVSQNGHKMSKWLEIKSWYTGFVMGKTKSPWAEFIHEIQTFWLLHVLPHAKLGKKSFCGSNHSFATQNYPPFPRKQQALLVVSNTRVLATYEIISAFWAN